MPEWLTFATVKDVLLALLAFYGAALSTFNRRQAVRKDRRSVAVKVSTAIPAYGHNVGPCFAKLEAVNTGHRSVTITTLAFELPTGSRLFPTSWSSNPGVVDTPLPVALSDGQSAHIFIAYAGIAAALIQSGRNGKTRVTPIAEDSVGNIYKGNPWDVDPNEFSRM
jgi:hypothetical protein